ncbi:2-amino-4-hydroxy-6-hydroxymethyldihydropteridine diphosphokinase [Ulvibacterium sp.]|uniref:2-amino-4-hydroxy-6- hydroxymethyldihydropteridine diphosphokinase n=1 Tax=Ulvibacterium sp. TaxID=2665914 RepID=UPI0026242C72|nr:2-amino-4-hydroxy-6-hydroxymethyldihydropteridine diphosphokinase [Ulvibacterium sp.]
MEVINLTYLSIGSNLGDRFLNIQEALFHIHEEIGEISAISHVYESASWGFKGEDFYNVCIGLRTSLQPLDLLNRILSVEKRLGRIRENAKGYASRTVDIDILYFENEIIDNDQLTIPHPKLHDRRFVLRPLADIAPQLYHPILQKDTRNLLQESKDGNIPKKTDRVLFPSREALFSNVQFIAIEGNIGAGKTTLARRMSTDFNGKLVLERFAENPFLPKFYEDSNRYAFPLEMSFLADRYQQFSDDTSQFDLFRNFMISDYDIYKSLIFAKITLQKEEFELYRKVFDFMYKEVKKPQIYVYLYQTTKRLLENIKKRGRDYERNIGPDYLEKINRGYFDFLKSYPKANCLIIDISEMDFVADRDDYNTVVRTIQNFALGQGN